VGRLEGPESVGLHGILAVTGRDPRVARDVPDLSGRIEQLDLATARLSADLECKSFEIGKGFDFADGVRDVVIASIGRDLRRERKRYLPRGDRVASDASEDGANVLQTFGE
jgi:hypothetical protein